MMRTAFFLALLLASPATAKPLTIKTGESWMFVIDHGQPAKARPVDPGAKPARGEVLVTVRALLGTTMSIRSNAAIAYTYRAELIGPPKSAFARSCTLPANGQLSFESWPQKATAILLSNFMPAASGGSCP